MEYRAWFEDVSGFAPRPWQLALGEARACDDRLIRIPTGFGKTLGVLSAWTYHSVAQPDEGWPRRLVFVLPMRALVEQVRAEALAFLEKAGLRKADAAHEREQPVAVHTLMGGVVTARWHLEPEQPAVLIGTQDMLLSRALNRGYASPRPRWPMEFGLLNQDALWVMDEVQLMGVGLTTSVQLQAFRRAPADLRPTATWWMSATLQSGWLAHGEGQARVDGWRAGALQIPADQRRGGLFDVHKSARLEVIPRAEDAKCRAWAELVWQAHAGLAPSEQGRITLAVCNTVDDAVALHAALARSKPDEQVELRLVHSRFRGLERERWAQAFLCRAACSPDANRVIVATQVVEAGVDISAGALVTQLAPWASLVQRVGRCARYGGTGQVVVVDRALTDKQTAPYEADELAAAREAFAELDDVGSAALEAFEERLREDDPARLCRLYPYEPLHVLTAREFMELFDNEPDLTGQDLDVSRFIREGDERDLAVFWWPVEGKSPEDTLQPTPQALCPVPVARARKWLLQDGRLKDGARAWSWDYVDGRWARLRAVDLRPGAMLLVDAAVGGYDPALGFTGERPRKGTPPIPLDATVGELDQEAQAELGPGHDELSAYPYKTIATHGREAAELARDVAERLRLPEELISLLTMAALLHDVGKCHPVFVRACAPERRDPALAGRADLAKAPPAVWRRGRDLFKDPTGRPRPGFRHELASTLMLFEWLYLCDPTHDALLGPHRGLIEAGLLGVPGDVPANDAVPPALAERLLALDADGFNLVAYLVCAHHGKVRATLSATPHDQGVRVASTEAAPIRGIVEGDATPQLPLALSDEGLVQAPGVRLSLDPSRLGLSARYGASWRERVNGLKTQWGPAALAYLETLLRVADVRASQLATPDALLVEEAAE